MKFNELTTSRQKTGKRVGRGIAAGQGKTAGRGTKGQLSRTGSSKRPGFTGGQNPLMQQLPKLPGFRSHLAKMETVYTGQLEKISASTVNTEALAAAGLISNPYVRVKLLHNGNITKAVTIEVQSASSSAAAAVKDAGGSVKLVPRLGRTPKKSGKSTRGSAKTDRNIASTSANANAK